MLNSNRQGIWFRDSSSTGVNAEGTARTERDEKEKEGEVPEEVSPRARLESAQGRGWREPERGQDY